LYLLKPDAPILLASGSPRRKELLSLMGVPFEIVSLNADENCDGTPAQRVCILAERKAEAARILYGDRIILAADTLVARGSQILGKPSSFEDAVNMLLILSGGWHEVYTGVCLLDGLNGKKEVTYDKTRVRFSKLDEPLAALYASTGEPYDKAGAYALQGRGGMFVEEIQGSASNVIGLPMALVRRMLSNFGVSVLNRLDV
jgi:septum formation protein